VYVDFYTAHYRVLFEEIGMPDGISVSEDLAYNKGLLCSPKQMEELFLPYFSEFVEFCHSFGLSVTIHSDGDIREAIPVILEAGFDGINPMEVKAGCDTLELADKYSDKLAFKGGLDVRVLESGDRGQIKKEVAALVSGMTGRGARYIFGSDHSVSSRVSYDDFLYAVEVYRENMDY
jgi:uroporphyrinogen decarboxylase